MATNCDTGKMGIARQTGLAKNEKPNVVDAKTTQAERTTTRKKQGRIVAKKKPKGEIKTRRKKKEKGKTRTSEPLGRPN